MPKVESSKLSSCFSMILVTVFSATSRTRRWGSSIVTKDQLGQRSDVVLEEKVTWPWTTRWTTRWCNDEVL